MRRGIAVAGAVLALMVPSVAHADASTAYESSSRALTKNQRIALSAIDAHEAAISRFANFLSSRPARVESIRSRIECIAERIISGGIYHSVFDSLPPATQQAIAYPMQYAYWYGYMFRILPRSKGRFSARAIKGIYANALERARKLNPDLTGERIIRGLRAQVDLIDLYRGIRDIRVCAVLDDWGTNGYDLDRLEPITSRSNGILLKIQASKTDTRIMAAVAAMQTVPGITSGDTGTFNDLLVEDVFLTIAQSVIP